MSDEPDDGFPWWLFWIIAALFAVLVLTGCDSCAGRMRDVSPF